VVVTAAAMFASIVAGVSQSGVGDFENRGGRKFLGVIFALFAFGGFLLIAAAMHKLGHSIYKDGLDPFADSSSDTSLNSVMAGQNDDEGHAGDLPDADRDSDGAVLGQ